MGIERKNTIGKRLITFAVPTLLGLLAIEGTLHLAGHGPITPRESSYAFDRLLGWQPIPSKNQTRIGGQYRSVVHHNAYGFRGPPLRRHPKERVLVLGDSFTEAYQLNWGQTFVGLMQQSFDGKGRNLEFINMGVAGYSTDQELLYYEKHAKGLTHQWVVLMFYASNDLRGNIQESFGGYAKPTLDRKALTKGQIRIANAPLKKRDGKSRSIFKRLALTTTIARNVLGSTWALKKLRQLGWQVSDISRPGAQLVSPPTTALLDAYQHFARISALLAKRVRTNGAKLLIAYVPSRLEANIGLYNEILGDHDGFDRLQGERLFFDVCRDNGLDCISTRPRLEKSITAGHACYFSRDQHWNATGHNWVAEFLGQEVAKRFAH
jgi:hypothetical protein